MEKNPTHIKEKKFPTEPMQKKISLRPKNWSKKRRPPTKKSTTNLFIPRLPTETNDQREHDLHCHATTTNQLHSKVRYIFLWIMVVGNAKNGIGAGAAL
jgi:hypothetical protein